jgi:hypothetical protein
VPRFGDLACRIAASTLQSIPPTVVCHRGGSCPDDSNAIQRSDHSSTSRRPAISHCAHEDAHVLGDTQYRPSLTCQTRCGIDARWCNRPVSLILAPEICLGGPESGDLIGYGPGVKGLISFEACFIRIAKYGVATQRATRQAVVERSTTERCAACPQRHHSYKNSTTIFRRAAPHPRTTQALRPLPHSVPQWRAASSSPPPLHSVSPPSSRKHRLRSATSTSRRLQRSGA